MPTGADTAASKSSTTDAMPIMSARFASAWRRSYCARQVPQAMHRTTVPTAARRPAAAETTAEPNPSTTSTSPNSTNPAT